MSGSLPRHELTHVLFSREVEAAVSSWIVDIQNEDILVVDSEFSQEAKWLDPSSAQSVALNHSPVGKEKGPTAVHLMGVFPGLTFIHSDTVHPPIPLHTVQ